MLDDILNIFFPEYCIGCNKSGSMICALCERKITTKPIALSPTSAALFDYRNPLVKKAIWALKYHRKKSLGRYFGIALYREFLSGLTRGGKKIAEPILLIPIPASQKALALRGYNHSATIAAAMEKCAKADSLPVSMRDDILYKKRENLRQAKTANKTERIENTETVFGIRHGEALTGITVILVDDVTTTGSTLAAARKAVKEYKPKRVLSLSVAH